MVNRMNLVGRNALVTGGASGIGAAVAESMVKAGANVTIVDVNEEALSATGKRLGVRAEMLDVSSSEAWADYIASHDHFDLVTSQGVLRLHDPRRFGAMVFVDSLSSPMAVKLLQGLGVEPLEEGFEPVAFHAGLKRRQAPIKQVLLSGDLVVGVGNIYASEALFRAGIRPTTRASKVSLPRARRLHAAIRDVLARALEAGGSTLCDFSNAQGQTGYFQLETAVYDRAGEPCKVCELPIRQIRQGQRSTFYCAQCQKP